MYQRQYGSSGDGGRNGHYYYNRRNQDRGTRRTYNYGGGGGGGGGGNGAGGSISIGVVTALAKRHLGLSKNQTYAFLAAVGAVLAGIWFLTPASDLIANIVLETVPMESDVELGLISLQELERDYPPVRDRWNVQRIGNELLYKAVTNQNKKGDSDLIIPKEFQYSFDYGVIHANFINAFALPGGIIRVTDKLLNTLNLTPMEIAALLGHEMGHVIYRHSQRQMIKQQLTSTVVGALLKEQHSQKEDEQFGNAVAKMLLKGAAFLGQLRFSRQDEYQADDMAWNLLKQADMDPRAVQRMLTKLWKISKDKGTTSWDSTHPGTKDRIQALKKKWNKLSLNEKRRYAYQ